MYGGHQEQQQQQNMSVSQSPDPNQLDQQFESSSSQQQQLQLNNSREISPCFDDGITIDADSLDPSSYEYGIPTFAADDNQLTISFRGQVFVFDSVTPDKVHAVLLLLGAITQSPDNALSPRNAITTTPQNSQPEVIAQQGAMEYAKRSNHPQREASLHRFRQKRKERCFDKKIRYDVRQEVALRMQRKKGQFSSSKSDDSSGCNGQDSGIDENQLETLCTHCGINSRSTPMMRRGPHGPRTLCNACGLFWANKGTLRDLPKKHDEVPPQFSNEPGYASPFRATDLVEEPKSDNFEEGDNPKLIAQH